MGNQAAKHHHGFDGTKRVDIAERGLTRVAAVSVKGWRETMEDAHDIRLGVALPAGIKDSGWLMLADGHGGDRAAKFAARHLLTRLLFAPFDNCSTANLQLPLEQAFLDLDVQLAKQKDMQIDGEHYESGATAVAAVITDTHIHVANCGDSRAVLLRTEAAVPLSFDHKPHNFHERNRIEAAGSFVTVMGAGPSRVNGELAVSRALGDFAFKRAKTPFGKLLHPAAQAVSAVPEVTRTARQNATDRFLVVACDGLWDVMSNEDVRLFILEREQRISARNKLAASLNATSSDLGNHATYPPRASGPGDAGKPPRSALAAAAASAILPHARGPPTPNEKGRNRSDSSGGSSGSPTPPRTQSFMAMMTGSLGRLATGKGQSLVRTKSAILRPGQHPEVIQESHGGSGATPLTSANNTPRGDLSPAGGSISAPALQSASARGAGAASGAAAAAAAQQDSDGQHRTGGAGAHAGHALTYPAHRDHSPHASSTPVLPAASGSSSTHSGPLHSASIAAIGATGQAQQQHPPASTPGISTPDATIAGIATAEDVAALAAELADEALRRGSRDNITIILCALPAAFTPVHAAGDSGDGGGGSSTGRTESAFGTTASSAFLTSRVSGSGSPRAGGGSGSGRQLVNRFAGLRESDASSMASSGGDASPIAIHRLSTDGDVFARADSHAQQQHQQHADGGGGGGASSSSAAAALRDRDRTSSGAADAADGMGNEQAPGDQGLTIHLASSRSGASAFPGSVSIANRSVFGGAGGVPRSGSGAGLSSLSSSSGGGGGAFSGGSGGSGGRTTVRTLSSANVAAMKAAAKENLDRQALAAGASGSNGPSLSLSGAGSVVFGHAQPGSGSSAGTPVSSSQRSESTLSDAAVGLPVQ